MNVICYCFCFKVREEYDTILALSITKWIHLNWGDAGMKRFFRRCFLHLNPGGRLILEAQDFAKYYKRAKMTVR
jgi:7SK snRNA methylphosphate capping enzyme